LSFLFELQAHGEAMFDKHLTGLGCNLAQTMLPQTFSEAVSQGHGLIQHKSFGTPSCICNLRYGNVWMVCGQHGTA
jgi:hypothetical protein